MSLPEHSNPAGQLTRRAVLQLALAVAATGADAAAGMQAAGETPPPVSTLSAKKVYDLSSLQWQLSGYMPYMEELGPLESIENIEKTSSQKVGPIPAAVPGSVQLALLNAGLLEDWNIGLHARDDQWVENLDWVYQTVIPDEWFSHGKQFRLHCEGLDYRGAIFLNGHRLAGFEGSFHPHDVALGAPRKANGNLLQILFQPPPRWLGQLGFTSRMKELKPRFNYGWDWVDRVVQTGIWDTLTLEVINAGEISEFRAVTDVDMATGRGVLRMFGSTWGGEKLRLTLADGPMRVHQQEVDPRDFASGGKVWHDLAVSLWWPNGQGRQQLYTLTCELLDGTQHVLDRQTRMVGFRNIQWQKTKGAENTVHPYLDTVPHAKDYLCVVNGKALFLCGVNWTPIRPNFADVQAADYDLRLNLYHGMGVNILRVWGGGFLEKEHFYNRCDQLGILVWQEFPLSGASVDSFPPDTPDYIEAIGKVAESYIKRRQHHAALLLWCGGNELYNNRDGKNPGPHRQPLTIRHPVLQRFFAAIETLDHGRRFIQTSPYGPRLSNTLNECGKGVFWDTHGPWKPQGPLDGTWKELWSKSESMFYSETGAPGASSAALINKYKGDLPAFPCSSKNVLWNRNPWWVQWSEFMKEKGRKPENLEEYVRWSQTRQAEALALAARAAKGRFPACGGFMVWMGHDAFPCTANTALIDFDGHPKPAVAALAEVFREVG